MLFFFTFINSCFLRRHKRVLQRTSIGFQRQPKALQIRDISSAVRQKTIKLPSAITMNYHILYSAIHIDNTIKIEPFQIQVIVLYGETSFSRLTSIMVSYLLLRFWYWLGLKSASSGIPVNNGDQRWFYWAHQHKRPMLSYGNDDCAR
jgi:hypothetical protein